MAEGEGFEPSVLLPVQRFSRPPRSTTPAPLLIGHCSQYVWCERAADPTLSHGRSARGYRVFAGRAKCPEKQLTEGAEWV